MTDAQSFTRPRGIAATLIASTMTLVAVAYALDVPRSLGLSLYTEQYLAAILALALGLAFLVAPRFSGRLSFIDPMLSLAGAISAGYVAIAYPDLINELVYKPWQGIAVSILIGGLSIEAVRRLTGRGLTIIVVLFLAYGLLGHLLPFGMSRQILWDRLSIYVVMDTNGLMGLPLMVTATMVFAFILLGQVLIASGGSSFFNDLALALVGRTRGGAAKIAVVSSFLFGSVSGSAVANVAASGGVTLPLMKRAGYKPHMAAAVEALASTGGQLAPPIMGAAAFLMAEFLQISFSTVVLAAVIPSALYYLSIFFYVDAHAAANDMVLPDDVEIRPLPRVMAEGWQYVVPFAILIYGLFGLNWRPEIAALAATGALAILAMVLPYRGRRTSPTELVRALPAAGFGMVEIVMISAAAGIVIGVLNISGLSFALTLQLVAMAQDSLFVLLIVAALVSVVLGMGMPTVGVYVLLASLIGPALVRAGIDPVAAHMFLLYFGMLSMITPPVALASFTAATMAGADAMTTGWAAVRMGWVAYLIPFVMVFEPGLVMQAPLADILWQAAGAVIGIWFATGAIYGVLVRRLNAVERGILGVLALAAILPVSVGMGGVVVNLAAIAVGLALVFLPRMARRA
ncbi:TRAP transporter fused permease subunit [Roseivivax marinus]|uniref:TRAP transporter permease n=1 Tax=Roseivivax marinus TaxID=1379903 RepID=UPI001F039F3F|nr:TRAP transporter fused permease subunit [Roseivivax marinus]UMA64410.1 TRAP transporter fused permease subunit [Roseivivax marinus]